MIKFESILVMVAGVAMMGILGGCGFGWTTSYIYENGEQYVAGDREISDKIEAIDIDYLSGDVTLTESSSDAFIITETSGKELDDILKVHTWVDGSTLYVKYCASAKKLDINLLSKKLTIGVPKGTNLNNLKMHVSSGDVDAVCSSKNIDIHCSSGDVHLDQKGKSDIINAHTSSGRVELNIESADKVDVAVSSGKIKINALDITEINSKTSSGDSVYTFTKTPVTSNLKASSGDITINLPKDADLSADLDTSSGDVSYELAFAKNGDNYVCGSGANKLTAHTSSGDVEVKALSN
jgi:DUF4097 and DUF4098 domain-containing protein YvlB